MLSKSSVQQGIFPHKDFLFRRDYQLAYLPINHVILDTIKHLCAYQEHIEELLHIQAQESFSARYQWWKEETLHMFQDKPCAHPLTKALARVIKEYRLPYEYFELILDATERHYHQRYYEKTNDVRIHCQYKRSFFLLLIQKTLVAHHIPKKQYQLILELGVALERLDHIQNFYEDLEKDQCFFSLELIEKFEINLEEDLAKQSQQFFSLFQSQYNELLFEYIELEKRLLLQTAPWRCPYLTLVRHSLALVYKAKKDKKHKVSLSPFRKSLIALQSWWP